MKRTMLTSIVTLMLLSMFAGTAFAKSDIDGHQFESEMRQLIDSGILKGDGKGNYDPDGNITRAQFAALLVRILDLTASDNPPTFKDVKAGQWYYEEVSAAAEAGLVKGYPSNIFKPDNPITREEIAVMVERVIEMKQIPDGTIERTFLDQSQISDWATSAVQTIVSLDIMRGTTNLKGQLIFAPKNNTTRGEVAAVLVRMLNLIGESNDSSDSQKIVITTTEYGYDFNTVLSMQADNSPKVDGAGYFTASKELVAYFLNPGNFSASDPEFFQFLKLSYTDGFDAKMINNDILPESDGNPLKGTAQYFLNAAEKYNLNPIYLIVHALHETANGTSTLAKGVLVTEVDGDPVEPKIVYNFFGIGAIDPTDLTPDATIKGGAEYAYKKGWFTVEAAINGGAAFISNGYISDGQDTLYKMRWNPDNPTVHQYATHVEWATSQAIRLYNMFSTYDLIDNALLHFEVPEYLNQPTSSPLPDPEDRYVVFEVPDGLIGETKVNLKFRTYPWGTVIETLAKGTSVSILGENGGWYKISVNGKEGWVSGDSEYFTIKNSLVIQLDEGRLNVRSKPNTNATIVGKLENNDIVYGVIDENGQFIMDDTGKWYKIHFKINGTWDFAWIYSEFVK
ncbi:S-layer homology domain-containing protein [Fervidibacillus albus]|uniref:S-layer homology domain-containing protein n=1 Tax=Fervidibacillus albus TaxID=2980026 RepID=A0A9E8LUE9_9BACI|nr:S-layer homology domain-containing protein [Fervidibacillus albus]WAA09697.1 S-layer homology domain-containing protein [Fervidibacillus albus]